MENSMDAIIPNEVLFDSKLTATEKLIYGELTTLSDNEGVVESYDNIHNALGVNKVVVNNGVNNLVKSDHIKILNVDVIYVLRNQGLSGLGKGSKTCEWCGVKTYILDKHHYPIPKSKGGKTVVDICANCHNTFHHMKMPIKLLRLFKEEWHE